MLLIGDAAFEERRKFVARGGDLARLYESLARELEPLLKGKWDVPREKACLSRTGGRCARDGALLEFDPWSPHRHRCATCGALYEGDAHDRWWIMSYQLWLAERAVHAALFHALTGAAEHAALARDVLRAVARQYRDYPNRDNVLGPSRVFFSTYLESIWLLQICIAADLLEAKGDTQTASIVCDEIVEPAAAIIAPFDEGRSNRQVWNNAALAAAAALLGDADALEDRVHGRSGLADHLSNALLGDGTWYEGENYHQFALRGLWYGVTIVETRGIPIDAQLRQRFQRAFETPFLTALPDFTMPSRKDSQYAVSMRQWRLAELTELGYARSRSDLLAGALARCYEPGHASGDTGRARSTADVERNGSAVALTRADLGWRALLHAEPSLPRLEPHAPRSALLDKQGIAVFRRAGDAYVALDYGEYGGGHGHPDRLNLTLAHRGVRWLDDMGTGSYVDPSLHWYRSTLAHNAPLVNGFSQPERDGLLRAHDERGALGWVVAEVRWPEQDVRLERATVVATDYLIDDLRWTAAKDASVQLPWHLDAPPPAPMQPTELEGHHGLEDGFRFAHDARSLRVTAAEPARLEAARDGSRIQAALLVDHAATLHRAIAPGQPASVERPFYVLGGLGERGRFRAVVSWSERPMAVSTEGDAIVVSFDDGERHVHRRDDAGWHVELLAGGARSSIDLGGWRPPPPPIAPPVAWQPPARFGLARRKVPVPDGWWNELHEERKVGGVVAQLGERHYRRSELSWRDAGGPTATIAFAADADKLVIFATVVGGERRFVAADAKNELDNEHPDTMGAGLQLYVKSPTGKGGWTLIPDAGESVRVRAIDGWGALPPPTARWRATRDGWEVRAELPLPDDDRLDLGVDVVVNETTMDRERRRGQLVMSGAHGEFVYLRGDRHDADRLIPLSLLR